MTRALAVVRAETMARADLSPLDDEALVDRIRAGDKQACEPLMRRYNQRLYRLARGITGDNDAAEDVLQEAYVRAFLGIDKYRSGNFAAWLARIVLNEARMYLRRRRFEVPLEVDDDGDVVRPVRGTDMNESNRPYREAADRELGALLERVIDRLPEPFRTVFVLRTIQQLSIEETAAALCIPAATVKSRQHRARSILETRILAEFECARADVFEFAGRRCDGMVEAVMRRLGPAPA